MKEKKPVIKGLSTANGPDVELMERFYNVQGSPIEGAQSPAANQNPPTPDQEEINSAFGGLSS